MQRKGFSLIQLLVVIACVALLAILVFPFFTRQSGSGSGSNRCASHLKQLGLALLMYTDDYNERLPHIVGVQVPAANNPYGWADALFPYVQDARVHHCPGEFTTPTPTKSGGLFITRNTRNCTDYWLNANFSGADMSKTYSPIRHILLGEGNDGSDMTDARYNLSALPATWLNNLNSPPYRHGGKGNYCFIDGHVQSLNVVEIDDKSATIQAR